MMPIAAGAVGLGRLTVNSALGEPLRAEIELTATRDEYASLSARLASVDAFRRAGINYSSALSGIQFTLGQRPNGQPYLKATSTRPFNEPFVDMLVEVTWGADRLVREYTFLLDPSDLFKKPAAVAALPPASDARKVAPVGSARKATADDRGGETLTLSAESNLNALARQRYPDDRHARDEFRRLMALARPELFAGQKAVGAVRLPAGTVLTMPPQLPQPANAGPGRRGGDGNPAAPGGKSTKAGAPADAGGKSRDRLLVGSGSAAVSKGLTAKKLEQLNLMIEEQGRMDQELSDRLKKSEVAFESLANNLVATLERLKQADAERARAVDEKIKVQAMLAKEQAKFGLFEMLLLMLACGATGAGLIYFYSRLKSSRQPLSSLAAPVTRPSVKPAGRTAGAETAPRTASPKAVTRPPETQQKVSLAPQPPFMSAPNPPTTGAAKDDAYARPPTPSAPETAGPAATERKFWVTSQSEPNSAPNGPPDFSPPATQKDRR